MVLLGSLGMFVFLMRTIPFNQYSRSQAWKHPNQATVGTMPPAQFTGKDPEEMTIEAELRPEVTGGTGSIEALRMMAATGKPYTLIMGHGKIMGSYVITNIQERGSQLNQDGSARALSFSMNLKKVSDSALGLEGAALNVAVSVVRNLTGI